MISKLPWPRSPTAGFNTYPSFIAAIRRKFGVAPPQPVPVDDHHAVQHPPVVNPWLAAAPGKEWPQALHLLVRQPKQVAHPVLIAEPESDRDPHIIGF